MLRRAWRTLGTVAALSLIAVVVAPNVVAAEKAKAHIYVVASKSFCASTGIADVYTGDGKIEFFLTLHNSGGAAGKVDVLPVRYYDDGGINESAMDMLIDVPIPARATRKFHSPMYTYKAHEHELARCAVKIGNGREVAIRVIHLQ